MRRFAYPEVNRPHPKAWQGCHAVMLSALCVLILGACGGQGKGEVDSDSDSDSDDAGADGDATHQGDVGLGDVAPLDGNDASRGVTGAGEKKAGVSLRRLDRLAYNNIIRDLLGMDSKPADAFPPDPGALGFDNLSDHLSISPLLMEHFVRAAITLGEEALAEETSTPFEHVVEVETLEAPPESFAIPGVGVGVYSLYPLQAPVQVPEAATYTFEVVAYKELLYWTGQVAPQLALLVDDETIGTFAVVADIETPETISVDVDLTAGLHRFAVRVMNPQYEIAEDLHFAGVVVVVDRFRVASPDVQITHTTPREEILICSPESSTPAACAETILRAFVRKAWRRPPSDLEIARLVEFVTGAVEQGDGFEAGIKTALTASLLSPHFLFLVEDHPEGEAPSTLALTDHQVAARLAHFLWSSMPDDALSDAADQGEVHTAVQIEAQARRMLADPKSVSLFDNLADQWMLARTIDTIQPNPVVFPSFDNDLRTAMADEVRLFLRSFGDLEGNRSIFDLLRSTDLFVRDPLAEHYGLDPVGDDFVHLETNDVARGGILRQAGVLAATSHPFRTSYTRRGVWILEKLLCEPIGGVPVVPGGVLEEPPDGTTGLNDTATLIQHISDPLCMSCHIATDPLGLGLEAYDAIGEQREVDPNFFDELEAIFDPDLLLRTPEAVIERIADDPAFLHCVVQKIYSYALGRLPLASDDVVVDGLVEQLAAVDYSFRELLVLIATSPPFRERLSVADDSEEERQEGETP